MFKMILEKKDGGSLVLHYDPHASALTHEDGAPVDLSPVGVAPVIRERRPIDQVHPTANPLPKIRRLKTVRILLGLACNYACFYCSQADSRVAESGREDIGDADAFIDRLPEWLHAGADDPVRFEFWGGESFVYWKKIERMAVRLRVLYPNAVMWIPTNGSLFDEERVAFLADLGIAVSISHDGPGQHQRGPDPFDDQGKAAAIRSAANVLAPQGRIAINSVLTREHHSLLALRDFFAERFADGWLPQLVTEGLVMTHRSSDLKLSPITEDDHRRIRHTLFADMAQADMIPMSFVSYKLRQIFDSLATARHSSCLGQRCGMDRPDSIAVRLNGDVIICPNGSAPSRVIGSVYDFDAIRLKHATHWSYRDECRHCPVLQICSGACMMFGEGTDKHRATCDNSFTVEIAYLALALYLLTGARLVRIEAEQIRIPGTTVFNF